MLLSIYSNIYCCAVQENKLAPVFTRDTAAISRFSLTVFFLSEKSFFPDKQSKAFPKISKNSVSALLRLWLLHSTDAEDYKL